MRGLRNLTVTLGAIHILRNTTRGGSMDLLRFVTWGRGGLTLCYVTQEKSINIFQTGEINCHTSKSSEGAYNQAKRRDAGGAVVHVAAAVPSPWRCGRVALTLLTAAG